MRGRRIIATLAAQSAPEVARAKAADGSVALGAAAAGQFGPTRAAAAAATPCVPPGARATNLEAEARRPTASSPDGISQARPSTPAAFACLARSGNRFSLRGQTAVRGNELRVTSSHVHEPDAPSFTGE